MWISLQFHHSKASQQALAIFQSFTSPNYLINFFPTITMQFSIFSASIILTGTALAQTVEWTDVPNICRPACAYTINLSQGCSHNTNDEYLDCVCDKPQSSNWVPNCEACVATFWDSDNGERAGP